MGIHLTLWGIHAYRNSPNGGNFDNIYLYPEITGLSKCHSTFILPLHFTPSISTLDRTEENGETFYMMSVRENYNVDYYGFTDGQNWVTYVIEWSRFLYIPS